MKYNTHLRLFPSVPFLLSLVLLIVLSSCGGQESKVEPSESSPPTTGTAPSEMSTDVVSDDTDSPTNPTTTTIGASPTMADTPTLAPSPTPTVNPAEGLLIIGVEPGSPGDEAGFQVGQRLFLLNGQPVPNIEAVRGILSISPDTPVNAMVLEGGEERSLTVIPQNAQLGLDLCEEDCPPIPTPTPTATAMAVSPPTETLSATTEPAESTSITSTEVISEGLLIVSVEPDSPAAEIGLEPGQILTMMEGRPTNDMETVRGLLSINPNSPVSLVVRDGEQELTPVVVPENGSLGLELCAENCPPITQALSEPVISIPEPIDYGPSYLVYPKPDGSLWGMDLSLSYPVLLANPIQPGAVLPWAVSPDGTTVALMTGSGVWTPQSLEAAAAPWLELWIVGSNGANARKIQSVLPPAGLDRQITSNDQMNTIPALTMLQEMAWSPDNQQVAFVSAHENQVDLYLAATDGTITRLTNSPDLEVMPRWSPDGSHIAVLTTSSFGTGAGWGGVGVHVIPRSGGAPVLAQPSLMLQAGGEATAASDMVWIGPDEIAIHLLQPPVGGGEVQVFNVITGEGNTIFQLENGFIGTMAWSETARMLAFTGSSQPNMQTGLFVWQPGQTEATPITQEFVGTLAWSVQGDVLAYSILEGETSPGIFVWTPGSPGSGAHITTTPAQVLRWSLDGQRLAADSNIYERSGEPVHTLAQDTTIEPIAWGTEGLVYLSRIDPDPGASPGDIWLWDGNQSQQLDSQIGSPRGIGLVRSVQPEPTEPPAEPVVAPTPTEVIPILVPPGTGATWQPQPSNTQENLFDISCPVAGTCFAVGERVTILSTSDSGASWLLRLAGSENVLAAISCPTADMCFAVGGESTVISTNTGGMIWTTAQVLETSHALSDISCPSVERCVVVGGTETDEGNTGLILTSSDSGITWTPSGAETEPPLAAVSCPTVETCVAVGNGGQVLTSNDGGTTWETRASAESFAFSDISCPTTTTCIAVASTGNEGAILTSNDSGATWTTNPDVNHPLFAVHCPTESRCVAVGSEGTILVTSDGGINWSAQTTDTATDLFGVNCPLADRCFLTGRSGTILAGSGF